MGTDPRAALALARRSIDDFDIRHMAPVLCEFASCDFGQGLAERKDRASKLAFSGRRRTTAPLSRQRAQARTVAHVFDALVDAAAQLHDQDPLPDRVTDPRQVERWDRTLVRALGERVHLATDPVIDAKRELVAEDGFDLPQHDRKAEVITQLTGACSELGMPEDRASVLVRALIDPLVADCVAIQAHEIDRTPYPEHLRAPSRGDEAGDLPAL